MLTISITSYGKCIRFAFLLLPLLILNISAQIRPARLFSDHAVLQRNKPIPVWGWAKPNQTLRVNMATINKETKADANGKWSVVFPELAGGTYDMNIFADGERLTIRDLKIGEVWLCSGQSNMEWTVRQAKDFETERMDAEYPGIRHFFVEHDVSLEPKTDLERGVWKKSSKETVGDFTAVGFFFARKIHQELGVPVGLIHSSWGGSEIEGWISKDAMLKSDELRGYAENFPNDWAEAHARLERKIKLKTLGSENANPTLNDERKYTEAGYDFTKWHKGSAMWQWDWQGIWAWRGNGYMAKTVVLSKEFVADETVLSLAEGYNYNEVYINGRNVFKGILKGKREVIVPKNSWRTGENRLVIKMNKMIEPEWFGLGVMGSAEDLYVAHESEKVRLGGHEWHLMPAFAEEHTYARLSNNVGTAIYNGMIAPLIPYAIRGVLWYQGESNAGRSFQYRKTFPLMIRDWRGKWNDEFPFYFVQLASFGANRSSNEGSGWAELREAQTMALSLPKTGMAVTTDIGDPDDVHPLNKQDVGARLAANALHLTYGKNIPHSSSLFDSVEFADGRASVSFKFVYEGLRTNDRYGYVRGFEIAGADRKFFYAQAAIDGGRVIVSHPSVRNPVAVRYAWSDAPVDANLYNSAGFPASPFRTDDWKGVTENEKYTGSK
jgi:sialate O-acetylesterase